MTDEGDKSISTSEIAEREAPAGARAEAIDDRAPETMEPRHRDAVMEGLEQSKAGRFASKKDLAAVLQRLRS
jgi:predicted transcriptional regulator